MLVLILSFSIVLFDQITKHLVITHFHLADAPRSVLLGIFSLKYVRNTGAAWGMLSGLNNVLAIFSVIMLAMIVIFRRHFVRELWFCKVAMGLMIGGIVGNLIDRVRLGYVVDFLDFYWKTHHFPAFNVADAAICGGVGLYILLQIVAPPAKKAE